MEISNNVKYIDDSAFRDCTNLSFIVVRSLAPAVIYARSTFDYIIIENCKFVVLSSAVETYKSARIWSLFNIVGGGLLADATSANYTQGSVSENNGLYQNGDNVSFTAMPKSGYRFVNWTSNDIEVSVNSIYSFTVTENIELVANFEEETSSISETTATTAKVYPNPTTDKVFIETANGDVPMVRVFNMQGTLLLQTQANEINMANYVKGIYLLEIDGETTKVVKK